MVSYTIDPYLNFYSVKNTDNMDASIFGFKIPFLPDFLTDRNLFGEDQQQKLSESFNRFERFLIGLRKYKSTAFSLRFLVFLNMGVLKFIFCVELIQGVKKVKIIINKSFIVSMLICRVTIFRIFY